MRCASSSVVNDCVRHSHWLYGVWNVIVKPIELICFWLLYMNLVVNVCVMCVSRRDNVCASRRDNVCASRRDSIMMPWHYIVGIIIPFRILIRFCDFGINKVAELLHANHKIIGKNHFSGSIQFGDFFRSKNSFHDNWGGGDEEEIDESPPKV